MKGGKTQGFTIVETLIFLAVSGLLSAMAFVMVAGQQQRAEFNYGVRDFANRIQDIVNDVSAGFYEKTANFTCTAGSQGPPFIVSSDDDKQGTNNECIFIGKVIQFAPSDVDEPEPDMSYRVFTVAGRRLIENGKEEVGDLKQTQPTTSTPSSADPNAVDLTSVHTNPYGLTVKWVMAAPTAGYADFGAVGFFTNFAGYNNNLLESGARNVDVVAITNSELRQTRNETVELIRDLKDEDRIPLTNPASGVRICLESSGGNDYAILKIGGNLRQLVSDLEFGAGTCEDAKP